MWRSTPAVATFPCGCGNPAFSRFVILWCCPRGSNEIMLHVNVALPPVDIAPLKPDEFAFPKSGPKSAEHEWIPLREVFAGCLDKKRGFVALKILILPELVILELRRIFQ